MRVYNATLQIDNVTPKQKCDYQFEFKSDIINALSIQRTNFSRKPGGFVPSYIEAKIK